MKLIVAALLFCFVNLTALAADSTIVKLAQKVIDVQIDKIYRHFYLFDRASAPEFNESTIVEINKATKVPQSILLELSEAAKLHQSAFYWKKFHLERAKIINDKHIPPYPPFAQLLKGMPSVDKDGNVIPNPEPIDTSILGETIRFKFSKPIFSHDKHYAFISTLNGESGGSYLLKYNYGEWVIVYQYQWMS